MQKFSLIIIIIIIIDFNKDKYIYILYYLGQCAVRILIYERLECFHLKETILIDKKYYKKM